MAGSLIRVLQFSGSQIINLLKQAPARENGFSTEAEISCLAIFFDKNMILPGQQFLMHN